MGDPAELTSDADQGNGIRLVRVCGLTHGIVPPGVRRVTEITIGGALLTMVLAEIWWAGASWRFLRNVLFAALILSVIFSRLIVGVRRRRVPWPHNAVKPKDCEGARLVCHGDSVELQRVAALTGSFPEPCVALLAQPRMTIPAFVILAGVFVISVRVGSRSFGPGVHAVTMAVPVLLVGWAYAHLVPTYYRVTPGRLEVLSFGFLGSRGKLIQSVDLTSVRIVCRYHKHRLDVFEDGHDKPTTTIMLLNVRAYHDLVEAIFNAGLCKYKAPALPTDSLLG